MSSIPELGVFVARWLVPGQGGSEALFRDSEAGWLSQLPQGPRWHPPVAPLAEAAGGAVAAADVVPDLARAAARAGGLWDGGDTRGSGRRSGRVGGFWGHD